MYCVVFCSCVAEFSVFCGSFSGFLLVDAQRLCVPDILHDAEPTRTSQLVTWSSIVWNWTDLVW